MKKREIIFIVALIILANSSLPTSAQKKEIPRVTVFSRGLALVEEARGVPVKKGVNSLSFGPVSKGIIMDSVYPEAEGCRFLEQEYVSDSLLWRVISEKERETLLRVTYLTTELSWKLNYQIKVDSKEKFMDLYGWATVINKTGMSFSQVYLTLSTEDAIFSYTSSYPLTLKTGEEKRIAILFRENVPVRKIYFFDGAKYNEEVREELVFENTQERGLGIAFPAGDVYIYKIEPNNKISFISKDSFPQILPFEKGRIYLREAKGIRGERVQTSYKQLKSSEKEYSYKIILINSRIMPVNIKVQEHFYGEWEIVNSTPFQYERADNSIIYDIEVPAGEEKEIDYRARVK
ncbi:MAG: DUF4139 domain-containing protein [Candidatus Aerophobetes bacterium]|nr:DUF4139 domain-containing protein [Candidatus Aerophobetes bacterium]